MSLKARTIVSLVCALLAILFTLSYSSSVREEAQGQRKTALERYGGETATVLVASRDIARGEVFNERNVESMEWLAVLLPDGALTDASGLMGKAAASSIAANTPIAAVDVSDQGSSVDVPAGLVAVSVPCSSQGAIGGAIAAGSVVDVYVAGADGARLLCPTVQVLQTNASGTAATLSWATLAVRPDQVEALVAASAIQKLYFTLPSDEELERRSADGSPSEAGQPVGTARATDVLPVGAGTGAEMYGSGDEGGSDGAPGSDGTAGDDEVAGFDATAFDGGGSDGAPVGEPVAEEASE